MIELIRIVIGKDFSIQVHIGIGFLIIFLIGLLILLLVRKGWRRRPCAVFEVNEAEIGIGDQKISFKPNYEDLQIAFRLWCELKTRKIGLSIDEENDVIVQVYDSWYEFFEITRELIKLIPVSKLRRHESTRQLVRISMQILNDELRPHLTKWQARFRQWYEVSVQKRGEKMTPQELQRAYPDYETLVKEMREVNNKMVAYAEMLERLVHES